MKKHYLLSIILIILSVCIAFAGQPQLPTQNGEPVLVNFGFKNVATPTITIHNDIVYIDDYLPAGALGFELRCASGSFVIGHPEDIATGTNRVGRLVSSGETYIWNSFAGQIFDGAILGTASSTVIVFDGVWGHFEP